MDQLCGVLPDVTPHAAIDSKMNVKDRRNRDWVRQVMRRIGRPYIDRGFGEQRTIVI